MKNEEDNLEAKTPPEEPQLTDSDLDEEDFFYIPGGNSSSWPTELPSQRSASDTSNWEGRTSTAPDGRVHIKGLDDDNTSTF